MGGGIAWLEREEGVLYWKKGLTAEEIFQISQKKGLPQVAHFRIGTVGGKGKELCHPFPVTKKCSLALEGETQAPVLFHNGHYAAWREDAKRVLFQAAETRLPGGEWSDSRALAWIAAHKGKGYLTLTGEKCNLLTVKGVELFGAFTEKKGISYSNLNWEARPYPPHHLDYATWRGYRDQGKF